MPAPKRPCANTLQDPPASKRCVGGEEAPNDKDESIIKLLEKCSQEQRKYIACIKQFLQSQEGRFHRLRDHAHYHLIIGMNRRCVRNSIVEQIKDYERKLAGQNTQEAMLKLTVKEMTEQEDKLEKIVKDVVNHKGYKLHGAKKTIRSEPTLYGSYEEELTDALRRVPTTKRDDARMEGLPKLRENDLDDIKWPEMRDNWNQYSIHWNNEFEEAAVCRSLNGKIKTLNERLVEEMSDFREVQAKKDRIKLYDEKRNCPIHADHIRNFERTELTEKLEQLIRKCFEKKVSIERLKEEEECLEALKRQREDLLKSIQEEVNTDSLKCSVCFEALTNGEQSLRCPQQFGSCGHTVCATCMTQFKDRDSPYHWTCPQCRAPSDKVLTNWALMQLIKEIQGQPQRVVVETPQVIPIVPAPFRLEERNDPEPVLEEDIMWNLIEDIDDLLGRNRRLLEDMNDRRGNRAPAGPALELPPLPGEEDPMQQEPLALAPPVRQIPPPVAPPPRAWAPVAQDPQALAPELRGFLIPPFPGLADPNFNPIFPPQPVAAPWAPFPAMVHPHFNLFFPQQPVPWAPMQAPQPFPDPWALQPAPVAVVQMAPAPQPAPQNPQAGHFDGMAAYWNMDEDEEDPQDRRYRRVSPIPARDWDSDVEDDEEWDEDEEQEDEPEDGDPDFLAALAPQPAPQNPQAGYIGQMAAEWDSGDEEEEDPQDRRYRRVSPIPAPDWNSDVEDDEEWDEDEEQEEEPEDGDPEFPAALALQVAPRNPRAGNIDRIAADWDIDEEEEDPQDPRYRGVSPISARDWDSDVEDDEEKDEDEDEEDDDDDEREDIYPEVRASPQPYLAPQASPADDDLEVIEVYIHAPPQVRAPAIPEQIEEEIEYIVVD